MLKRTIKTFVDRLLKPAKSARPKGPRRYTREEHGIDRRLVSRHAIKVCEVLNHEGYQAYVVGGAVRDLIVGRRPKDFDVATDARPEQIRPLFRRALIIGRRFRLAHVKFGTKTIEVATFRTDGVYDDGRHPTEVRFTTAEEDAKRRDFTINGLFLDPIENKVIDYVGGLPDVEHRIIRTIGDPMIRLREDGLRWVREGVTSLLEWLVENHIGERQAAGRVAS